MKKSSNGSNPDETSQTGQSQIKLMPILEGGESEDKSTEFTQSRLPKEMSLTTTTIDWTPTEYVKILLITFRNWIQNLSEMN